MRKSVPILAALAVLALAATRARSDDDEGGPGTRFRSVTGWRGEITVELRGGGRREAYRKDPDAPEAWQRFRGTSETRYSARLSVRPNPDPERSTPGTWACIADTRVHARTVTRELSTANNGFRKDSCSTIECDGSSRNEDVRVHVDFGKNTYDLEAAPVNVLFKSSQRIATIQAAGEAEQIDDRGPTDVAEFPVGATPTDFMPVPVCPLGIAPKPPSATALASIGKLRFTLPDDPHKILQGEKSYPVSLVLPKEGWRDEPLLEDCVLVLRWTLTPADAILKLEPTAEGGSFEQWEPLPLGVPYGGKRLRVRAFFTAEGGGEPPRGIIRFRIKEKSRHRGECNNWPIDAEDEKDDLVLCEQSQQPPNVQVDVAAGTAQSRDRVSEATVVLEARDTGAYGKLEARCDELDQVAECLDPRYGGRELTIPFDADDNHCADVCEKFRGTCQDEDEDEKPRGHRTGDGYNAYDEYRGFRTKHGFERTDPKKKSLLVLDKDGFVASFFGTDRNPADLELVFVDQDQIRWDDHFLSNRDWNFDHRWTNPNSDKTRQYALVVERGLPLPVDVPPATGITWHVHDRMDRDGHRPIPAGFRPPGTVPVLKFGSGSSIKWVYSVSIYPGSIDAEAASYASVLGLAGNDPRAAAIRQRALKTTVVHEIGHALSIPHHGPPGGGLTETWASIVQGVPGCVMRYNSEEESTLDPAARPPAFRKALVDQSHYCKRPETFRNDAFTAVNAYEENGTRLTQRQRLWDGSRPDDASCPAHDCYSFIDVRTDD